ncbi:MAG: hypothetical protein H0U08_04650 [Actinobacteria bacterium]|nr:hypothetical protein [Actinomycetota bacterium]
MVGLAGVLAFTGTAQACVCVAEPLDERVDRADAAVIGRVVGETTRELNGARQKLLTFEVDQSVKGDVEETLVIRSPSGSDCDLETTKNAATGLLLTRAPDGGWLGTTCSLVTAGELVALGGEPRGGVIKVVLGILILAIVLSWALRRRARGVRPNLPGAPEP